jgi:hypothetical protein
MLGAIQRSKSAAVAATMRPAVRWGGLAVIAASVLLGALALTKAQPKAPAIPAEDALVLAADATLGDAMRAGDITATRRLLALQFNLVDASGKIYARKETLADLKGLAAAPASDVKVRSYGLVAAVTGHHKAARDTDVFFLNVWVKQKGAWRALLIQDVPVAEDATGATATATAVPPASAEECKNPCQTIPYRVRSAAEQDVISSFQTIMKAIVAHDATGWSKYVADEFRAYTSDRPPIGKAERIATIERQKELAAPASIGEVQTMHLAVFDDGAVMTATEAPPDPSRPTYRAARLWMRRNGQWLMALSAHTDVK